MIDSSIRIAHVRKYHPLRYLRTKFQKKSLIYFFWIQLHTLSRFTDLENNRKQEYLVWRCSRHDEKHFRGSEAKTR